MVAEPGGPRKRIDGQIVELSIKAGEGLLVELKAKGSITELISRLLGETSSEKQTYSRFQESSSVDRESRDRTLQSTVEQIHDDPVPEMVEQLVKLPKTVSQDEIQTVQTMEVPLLQFNKVVDANVVVQAGP